MTTTFQSVVVPTVPPQPPQVTLVGSAVKPTSGSDPANPVYEISAEQLAAMPDDQRAELQKRQGDAWVRGLTYQPESHSAAGVTAACKTGSPELTPLWSPNVKYKEKDIVEWLGAVWEAAEENEEEAPKRGSEVWKVLTDFLFVPENIVPVIFVPFVITHADRCTTFGFEEHDYKGRAQRALDNATPHAIEREFWTGAQAQLEGWPNDYLTNESTTTILNAGKETSAARGLQILQDALSQCGFGGRGMIHMEREAAPNLLSGRRIGPDYLDIFDNYLIPGVGYDGSAPGGESAEERKGREEARETWMYATDLVMTRQSDAEIFPDTFAEATDWGQGPEPNTITFYAERFGAAYFDGACHFAVKVKLAA